MDKVKKVFVYIKRRINSFFLRGDKFECPLCGKKFNKFMPYGANPVRKNVCCPNCGSLERHRLLWVVLQKMWKDTKFCSTGKLLHVAPEPVLENKFVKMFDYISIDLAGENAMMAMDITDLKFSDEEFDAVVCNHVLEHVIEDKKAISEMYRVMKHGSWGSIQVPMKGDITDEDLTVTSPVEREKRYGQCDHVRQYGSDYVARLKEAGFKVLVIDNNDFLNNEELNRMLVPIHEVVVLVKKE